MRQERRTDAVSCPACRSKVGATRHRCPRCGTPLGGGDPGTTARSRRLSHVAAVLVALFLVGCAVIHLAQPVSGDIATAVPPDPLAARRAVPASPPPVEDRGTREPLREPVRFEPIADAPFVSQESHVDLTIARLTATVERHPNDAEAHSALGELLAGLSRTEDALPYLRRAVDLNSERGAYHLSLGRALAHLQHWDEALASYRAARAAAPDDAATTAELTELVHRIAAYERTNRIEPAAERQLPE